MRSIEGDTSKYLSICTTQYNCDGHWSVDAASWDELSDLGYTDADLIAISNLCIGGMLDEFENVDGGVIVIRVA